MWRSPFKARVGRSGGAPPTRWHTMPFIDGRSARSCRRAAPRGGPRPWRGVFTGFGRRGVLPSLALALLPALASGPEGPRGPFPSLASGLPAALGGGLSAQAPPPHIPWYTLETPHFDVVFHEGLETLARRVAERAERAMARLEGFGSRPSGRIQVVVTDHADLSNGFARIAPYPRITIWARPPAEGVGAMPYDDWLELVVTHELVHILHLEMTSPLGRAARALTGRAPLSWPHFPAFLLPTWGVEGVAVQAESDFTGGGRMHGARFDAMVRASFLPEVATVDTVNPAEAARTRADAAGGGERLDQVTGRSPRFPGGERPYVWGGAFFHDLAHDHGPEAVARFFERQATGWNPLDLEAAAREAFDLPLTALHDAWLAFRREEGLDRAAAIRVRALAPVPERLTRGSWMAMHPLFLPAGMWGRGADQPGTWILGWTRADGRGDPAFVVADAVADRDALDVPASVDDPRVVTFLHQTGPLALEPGGGSVLTVEPEYMDRFRIRSDLWRIHSDGRRERVTRGRRVAGVDAHPIDGRLVATLDGEGTKTLVLLAPDGTLLRVLAPADPGVHWSHPRWSPDGRWIAVTRWRAGGWWAVGLLDPAADPGDAPLPFQVLDETPVPAGGVAWMPDGRGLVWSSERSGVANLHVAWSDEGEGEAEGGSPLFRIRQLTDVPTAAVFPVVHPDGRSVLFSLLGAEGWELARIPLSPGMGFPAAPVAEPGALARAMEAGHDAGLAGEVRPWSPRATLRPRHWLPRVQGASTLGGARVLGPTLGFESWAADAVDRHRWDVRLDLPAGGPGRRWEGEGRWRWAGLGNPVLSLSVSQRWDPLGRVLLVPEGPDVLYAAGRERAATLSVQALRPRWRSSVQTGMDLFLLREDRSILEEGGGLSPRATLLRPRRDFVGAAWSVAASTARSAAFEPGPARGGQLALRLRARQELALADTLRGVAGRDGSQVDALLSARGYLSVGSEGLASAGGALPVLALRGAGAVAVGPGAGPSSWRPGGGGGGGGGALGFTWDRPPSVLQVRGFEAGIIGGARAWGAGAELRVPLAVVHRGWAHPRTGLLPLHLDRVAATLWGDIAGTSGVGAGPPAPATAPPSSSPGGMPGEVLDRPFPLLASAGGEVILLHTVLHGAPALLRGGVAVPVLARGTGLPRPTPSVYAALGWSF